MILLVLTPLWKVWCERWLTTLARFWKTSGTSCMKICWLTKVGWRYRCCTVRCFWIHPNNVFHLLFVVWYSEFGNLPDQVSMGNGQISYQAKLAGHCWGYKSASFPNRRWSEIKGSALQQFEVKLGKHGAQANVGVIFGIIMNLLFESNISPLLIFCFFAVEVLWRAISETWWRSQILSKTASTL